MKQLMILRHAQALGVEPGGDDKSRKLSPKGIEDAKALGALMERQNLQPDLVLCSAAVRTRQTLDGLLNVIAVGRIDYSDTLYNADFSVLLNAVQGQSNDINNLLLVAHNPGIHTFAARLASDESEQFLIERLMMSYAPATMTVLQCDIENWADLEVYQNPVLAVHETSAYNSDDRPTRWM